LLTFKQTWAFITGKFITDPVWWFYLFWLPSFLNKQYGLSKTELMLPIAVVYTMTTFGSIFGGWLSGFFISKGWPIFKARRTTLLLVAMCALPVLSAQYLGHFNMWLAVLIIGLATSAHQAFSANLLTSPSDMFPKKLVASVIGIGGMAGGLSGVIVSKSAGLLLDHYKALGSISTGYSILFVYCGSAYLVAWVVFSLLVPKMKRVEI
jgi:ACS family hexuronate transporter-like MFS transporter